MKALLDQRKKMAETRKKLECPFTWALNEDLAMKFDKQREMFVNVDDQPVKAIVYPATLVFVYMTQNDVTSAYEKMQETVNNLKTIKLEQLEEAGIAATVLVHIVRATKYHYFMVRKNDAEAQKALINAPDLDSKQLKDKTNLSTLNGCKSIAWSVFHGVPKDPAISYLKLAIADNPGCALWHFMMGRKLRSRRRDDFIFEPTADETKHLLKAYELSKDNLYIGAFVAQLYWEKRNQTKAKELCRNIFDSKPESVGIAIRLSKLFIRTRDYERAKECLDFVQNVCSDNVMYLHFKAMYFEKQKNYKMAALYYDRSAKTGNFGAEIKYGETRTKLQDTFNIIGHLDNMLQKYSEKNLQQQLQLHIAMQYYFNKKDVKNSMIYFKKAIEINPNSAQLKTFFNSTVDNKKYNIFHFVKNHVLKNEDCTEDDVKSDLISSFKNMKL